MTYDREVLKFDAADMAKWHKDLFGPPPEVRVIAPTSEHERQKWRYTTEKPPADWLKPDFEASAWKEAEGGFGTKGTPGAVIGTEWKTSDIWLRRTVDLAELPDGEIMLRLHHDDDAEVYINGVLAARATGFTTDYGPVPLTAAGRKALQPGKNVIAIHCHQEKGGQFIDAGLVVVK
jgi:hypothetical protein